MKAVSKIGMTAAHISWAVFIFMLLYKYAYPSTPWLFVLSPFLIPIFLICFGLIVLGVLYTLIVILTATLKTLKYIRNRCQR